MPSPRQLEALCLMARGRFYPDLVREDDGWYARWRPFGVEADECFTVLFDGAMRSAVVTPLTADGGSMHRTLHDAWIDALRSESGKVAWDASECETFAAELAHWHGGGRDPLEERKAICFTFDVAASTISCALPQGRAGLRELGRSVMEFAPLRGMEPVGDGVLSVVLTRTEAELFLKAGARRLAGAGYGVDGADIAAEVSAVADVLSDEGKGGAQDGKCKVKLTIRVAGMPVSAEDIRFMLEQGSALVFFRNRWLEVDRGILRQALRVLEKSGEQTVGRNQALAFASGIGRIGALEMEEVAAHGWLRGLVEELRRNVSSEKRAAVSPEEFGRLFKGELRDYQWRGVEWMGFLVDHGFGALLADDMGLGKTVQVIAWMVIDAIRNADSERAPVLIVAPLTLLSNWSHEFAKFAPSFRVYVHHGRLRQVASGFKRTVAESDVVITSYNLLVKDHSDFGGIAWHAMVLDEAQCVKNSQTAVSRACRALAGSRRIALTGTPVENSAEDVWSIEEFLNPGFLGERKSFSDRFVKPLAANPQSSVGARLARALEPFVLRRLKTDPGIAEELGEKREIREYCRLGDASRREYEEALADYRATERSRGDAFALLTRLKLICDGDGKFERLVELIGQITQAGESVLVFTQYAKVGIDLRRRIGERLGIHPQFLHGGLSAKKREGEIAEFRDSKDPAVFILSLRAGGFGLNLTKATHVIHYDRWWNPAVEDQATDRAHRIGQTRTVFVHLMMTAGTVEEHVDDVLERKSMMSGTLVKSGESFLTQLPDDVFERMVSLDEQA